VSVVSGAAALPSLVCACCAIADVQTVQPVIETAQPLVVDVYHKTVSINTYLIQRAEQTVASSGDLGHNLVEQLKYLASHGKELPSELIHVSAAAKPVEQQK